MTMETQSDAAEEFGAETSDEPKRARDRKTEWTNGSSQSRHSPGGRRGAK